MYFVKWSTRQGDLAQMVFDSPGFFDSKWLNKTTRAKIWQTEVGELRLYIEK